MTTPPVFSLRSGLRHGTAPVSRVTPFTYRDGSTFLEILKSMIKYINGELIDQLDDAFKEQAEWLVKEIDDFTEKIELEQLEFTDQINSTVNQFMVDITALVDSINNRVGPAEIIHIDTDDRYDIGIDPLWPTNQPVTFRFTGVGEVYYDGELIPTSDSGTVVVGYPADGSWVFVSDLDTQLFVDDFGAVGDGVTNDETAIRLALQAASRDGYASEVVFTGGKTYYMGDARDIMIPGNTIISGNGATIVFEDETDVSIVTRFRIQGTSGTQTPLSTDLEKGLNQVSVANPADFSVGGLAMLHANTPQYPGNAYMQGEIFTIRKIVGNVLTFHENAVYEYLTERFAYARPVTPITDVHVKDLKIIDSGVSDSASGDEFGQRAINIRNAYNVSVTGCKFTKTDSSAVVVYNSINFNISNNEINCTLLDTHINQKIYCIALFSFTRNGKVDNNNITGGATGIAFSDTGADGNILFINVTGNIIRGANRGISTHDNNAYINIDSNVLDSCSYGINYRTRHGSITNNQFINSFKPGFSAHAIYLSSVAGDLVISGNTIDGCWTAVYCDRTTFSPVMPFNNIVFTNNVVRNINNIAIDMEYRGDNELEGLVISGNSFSLIGGSVIRLAGMIRSCVIMGNYFGATRTGAQRVGVQGIGLRSCAIVGNTFHENMSPVTLASDGARFTRGNTVVGNAWRGDNGIGSGDIVAARWANANSEYPIRNVGVETRTTINSVNAINLESGDSVLTTHTVPGIAVGDIISSVTHENVAALLGLSFSAQAVDDDTVQLIITNHSSTTSSLNTGAVYLVWRKAV